MDGEIESTITAIWSEVLRIECVGSDENFFELGGQSLQGMKVLECVAERLKVRLPFLVIFQFPTVGQMAELVRTRLADDHSNSDRESAYFENDVV